LSDDSSIESSSIVASAPTVLAAFFAFAFATLLLSFSCAAFTTATSTAVRLPKPFSGFRSLLLKSPTLMSFKPLILSF
jgi:hypothetical protein